MEVKAFFHAATSTLTYIVYETKHGTCIVIDPVLDFDLASGKINYEQLGRITAFVKEQKLSITMILETHAHADHLSGAYFLKKISRGAPIGIGRAITTVQKTFAETLALKQACNGSQFDRLFRDKQRVKAGSLEFEVITTPGHTPACVAYHFEGFVFTGDTIFMPDFGTGRCDFPGGSPQKLFRSIKQKIYTLPSKTKIYVGHDYQPGGRELRYCTSVKEQKKTNIHLKAKTKEKDFVEMRRGRDNKLSTPRLLYPSLQVNIQAGRLPRKTKTGHGFLKLPVIHPYLGELPKLS